MRNRTRLGMVQAQVLGAALLLVLLAALLPLPTAAQAPAPAAGAAAQPGTFKVDPVHSSVAFTIRHFVSEVEGRFKDFAGTVKYDPQHPADSSVQFTVQAASIDTDNEARDKDLRSENFFDVQKYPTLTFTSTKVTPKGDNAFDVTGNLSIHGVTSPVLTDTTYYGLREWNGTRVGFSATTTLHRQDFTLNYNQMASRGIAVVGSTIEVHLDVQAVLER